MAIIMIGVAVNLRRQGIPCREALGLAAVCIPMDGVLVASVLV